MTIKENQERRDLEIEIEANRVLNYLASVRPDLANITVENAVAKKVLLDSCAQMLLGGTIYEITLKSLDAGVYRMGLKEWKPEGSLLRRYQREEE